MGPHEYSDLTEFAVNCSECFTVYSVIMQKNKTQVVMNLNYAFFKSWVFGAICLPSYW